MYLITNYTNPGADPADGDEVEYVTSNGTRVRKTYHVPKEQEQEAIEQGERLWRDQELKATDWIVPVTDHPQHAAYMTYRQALRDWPSTADFPDTKPVLGS